MEPEEWTVGRMPILYSMPQILASPRPSSLPDHPVCFPHSFWQQPSARVGCRPSMFSVSATSSSASLYEALELKKSATHQQVENNYRVLFHRYTKENKIENLFSINEAKRILSDPYKRQFYDVFGNSSLQILRSPTQGHLYPRLLCPSNLLMLSSFLILSLFNTTCYYYFYILFRSCFPRNFLLSFSPILLLAVAVRTRILLGHRSTETRKLSHASCMLLLNGLEIAMLSLFLDSLTGLRLSLFALLFCRLASVLVHFIGYKGSLETALSLLYFEISKTGLLSLYFIGSSNLTVFIPAFVVLSFSLLVLKRVIFVEVAIFIYSLGLYLSKLSAILYYAIFFTMACLTILFFIFSYLFIAFIYESLGQGEAVKRGQVHAALPLKSDWDAPAHSVQSAPVTGR